MAAFDFFRRILRNVPAPDGDAPAAEDLALLNAAAPAVIISQMSFDRQEQLMVETRQYLNAEVWLALNDQMVLGEDRQTALKKLLDKWYRHSLDRLITRYNHHKDNADGAEEP